MALASRSTPDPRTRRRYGRRWLGAFRRTPGAAVPRARRNYRNAALEVDWLALARHAEPDAFRTLRTAALRQAPTLVAARLAEPSARCRVVTREQRAHPVSQ